MQDNGILQYLYPLKGYIHDSIFLLSSPFRFCPLSLRIFSSLFASCLLLVCFAWFFLCSVFFKLVCEQRTTAKETQRDTQQQRFVSFFQSRRDLERPVVEKVETFSRPYLVQKLAAGDCVYVTVCVMFVTVTV